MGESSMMFKKTTRDGSGIHQQAAAAVEGPAQKPPRSEVNDYGQEGVISTTTMITIAADNDYTATTTDQDPLFLYGKLHRRLDYLELWRELGVRPATPQDCLQEDQDLMAQEVDNLSALNDRCLEVRSLMNQHLPLYEHMNPYNAMLKVTLSGISNAGQGLFYVGSSTPIPPHTIMCYYYGHIHTFQSARHIHMDDRSYLMAIGTSDRMVDPGPLMQIKARYINDPLNDRLVNCRYMPDVKYNRSAVVTTRTIAPNSELFASYGDAYWANHATLPSIHK
jgi:hypothetical protein